MTLTDCFNGAWRDAWRAALKMPHLFIMLFVVLLGFVYLGDHRIAIQHSAGADPAAPGQAATIALLSVVLLILTVLLSIVLSIKIMRLSLLGEVNQTNLALVGRVLLLHIIIGCAAMVIGLVIGISAALIGVILSVASVHLSKAIFLLCAVLIGLFTFGAAFYVAMRLNLLSPHVATGGRYEWRKAWHDTRGRFWSMVGTVILTSLPALFFYIVLAGARMSYVRHANFGDHLYYALAILSALAVLALQASSAASYAWLYRRYALALKTVAA